MRHIPFFKALSDYADDVPAWRSLAAGFLVLRTFDDWLQIGSGRLRFDMNFSRHFKELEELPDDFQQERRVLVAALTMMTADEQADPRAVVAPLLAYGAILEFRGHYGPAADLYETVVDGLEAPGTKLDFRSIANALMRAGACWANGQEYDRAVAAYTRARQYAADTADDALHTQIRGLLANVMRAQGDLPGAEAALDELLHDVAGLAPHVVALTQPWVLHCRGAVRHARGRYPEAIQDFFDAYQGTLDPFVRELILSDLGVCASDAGYRDTARNALEIITLATRHPLAYQSAIVNLMEIAVLDGDRIAFERWKALWRPEQCNPLTNAYARLYLARGSERFRGRETALEAFHAAVVFAETVKAHQVQFEALQDIDRLHEMKGSQERAAITVPPSLNAVAEALADIRGLVEYQR